MVEPPSAPIDGNCRAPVIVDSHEAKLTTAASFAFAVWTALVASQAV